jgi:pimeloyl-ACP methyl ester carboxylesterase
MVKFKREVLTVDGVKTVIHTAGKGDPVVFFHGAGTADGFDAVSAWTDRFRVIVPYHPGFGESGDDPTFTDFHDYVMHYLELFDLLKLKTFRLVGLSLGGNFAARFAMEHGHRVEKLVLIAPYGMIDPKNPATDLIPVPGDKVLGLLVSDINVLLKLLPAEPDIDFIGDRYREAGTFARLVWEHPYDAKFVRYLHRIKSPTLIVWGDEDKVVPVAQTKAWKKAIPHAEIKTFKKAGHLVYLDKPEAMVAIGKFLA